MRDPKPNVTCAKERDPERYCLNFDDPVCCNIIGDICDEDGTIKPEYAYCKTD